MMNTTMLLLVLALLGADPAPPLPTALREAHTVYVINRGVSDRVFKHTLESLAQLHRWTMTADRKDADITLAMSPHLDKWSQAIEITAPDGTPLYGATFSGFNPEKELKKLAKRLEEQ